MMLVWQQFKTVSTQLNKKTNLEQFLQGFDDVASFVFVNDVLLIEFDLDAEILVHVGDECFGVLPLL